LLGEGIGGGPGHMAFWLNSAWDNCHITVADKFSSVGNAWAKEIGIDRVNFVDSYLPALNGIDDHCYDVILMSRVFGNIKELNLPGAIDTYSSEAYLDGLDGQRIIQDLERIADTINRVLTNTGSIIIGEFWSDDRLFLISRVFESKELFINLDLFDPKKVSHKYTAIIFSKTRDKYQIQNRPLGLSSLINFTSGPHGFVGHSAEAMRKFFNTGKPHMQLEYKMHEGNVKMLNEIIEKEGLALLFRTGTNGRRTAWIYPAMMIPVIIHDMMDMVERIRNDVQGEILSINDPAMGNGLDS